MENTRKQLIDLLETRLDQYTSGQMLSDKLNISRAAVWKHMKELEKDGYRIEAIAGKGYMIVSHPQKISANTIKWGLHTDWLGQHVIHKPSVTSTQQIAHIAAMEGAKNGTIIVADEQTEGKGRMDRSWHSAKNKGIWMSMILRPEILPTQAPQITLLAASALAELMERTIGVTPQIKWPNDILINHKKTAGILTEMQSEQDQIRYIVLGIGINVNHDPDEMPEDIRSLATSLKIESNQKWNIQTIIQEFLTIFEKEYDQFLATGFEQVKKKWERYGYKIGEVVPVQVGKELFDAKLIGIEADGALRVKKADSTEKVLYSAEIQWQGGRSNEE